MWSDYDGVRGVLERTAVELHGKVVVVMKTLGQTMILL